MKRKAHPIDVLDTVYHEAALVESERGKHTAEQMRWAKGVAANLRERIAEKRRALIPATIERKQAGPISAALVALDRPGLLAKLAELVARGAHIQYAHRNLKGLSDDDLRQMLQLLEPMPTTKTPNAE